LWKKINTGEVWQCCTVLHPFRIRLCDTFGLEKVERSWGLLETDSWKYDHIGTVTKCHADPDNDSADDESENIYEPVAKNKKALWVVTDCCIRQPFWGKKRIPKHQQSAVYHWKRVLNEISKYEIEAYPGCASPGEFELLQWWGERAHRFPLLSGVAKRVLMIPASSADCERHFTAFNARSIITAQLNSMFP